MREFLERYVTKLSDFPQGFVDTDNLMHWQWFVWNLLAVAILVLIFSKNKKRSWRRFKAHLRSKRAQKEVSLDIQFFILKILYQPLKLILFIPILIPLAVAAKNGGLHLVYGVHGSEKIAMAGAAAHIFKALWVLMAYDLASYWSHRLQHKVSFFWHLHSVHHRATYLAPLLKYRTHPFDTFINNVFSFSVGAFAVGIFEGFYVIRGARAEYAYIYLGISFLVHFIFGHIRHSQYWISYGPYVSRIIMSPAMHQIHHSLAPEHQGKNLASMFSFWDLIFGTIYIPVKKEVLRFGDSPGIRQENKTLWKEVKMPLIHAIRSLQVLNPFMNEAGGRQRWLQAAVLAFVALVFGLSSCTRVAAQEESMAGSCTEMNEVSLPAVMVNSLAEKNNRDIYLPVPLSKCFKPGLPVILLDPYRKTIGQFFPEKTWSGTFTGGLESGPQNTIAKEYADLLLKDGIVASRLSLSLIRIMFPNDVPAEKANFQIWKGLFKKNVTYYFDDQNLAQDPLSPSPKIISYDQLVKGIIAGQPVFTQASVGNSQSWRVPTTKMSLQSLGPFEGIMSLAALQREVSNSPRSLQEICGKPGVLFYGSVGVSADFFNVYDWLRASGCKDISWFSGGELEWQLPKEKDKFLAVMKKETIVSGQDLQVMDPLKLVIDMRPAYAFNLGHIPGAVNFQLLDYTKVSYINNRKRSAVFSFSVQNMDKILDAAKGKKQVIFYTDHKDVMELQGLDRLIRRLREERKIPAKLYLGGFRDWENRTRWLGEAGGYRIEGAAKKTPKL